MRLAACLTALGLLALPAPAAATCGGTDLMAELAARDPAAHAAIEARADAVPNGRGIFWKVERAGVPASFLYGTVHGTEAAARWLLPEAIPAFEGAREVIVEMTPAEQTRMQARVMGDPSFVMNPDPPTLTGRVPADRLEAAKPMLAARGLPMPVADMVQPWMLISVIALPLCELQALAAGGVILDDRIATEALEAGRTVSGLETYEQALGTFAEMEPAMLSALLADGLAGIPHEEDLRRTLESLYQQGRIAAILEFNIWFSETELAGADSRAATAELERTLIALRNERWMERLLPALEAGNAFVATGALHLPGENGLVELLRARGWTVTRADG